MALLGGGCGSSEEQAPSATGPDPTAAAPPAAAPAQPVPRPKLRCEEEGFPCAWSEVAPEVARRTDELAREGVAMLDSGASAGELAVRLASLDEVTSVATDGTMVRFRLAGGRPVWVAEAAAELMDTRSFASPALAQNPPGPASGPDDPIGENPPGKKPWKKALILAPFQWHFGDREVDDLQRHLGVALTADQDPFAVRDYRCDASARCVEVKANDVVSLDPNNELYCSQHPGSCPMSYGVERADFKTWRNFDLIHLGTHGFYLCGTADPEEVVQWLTSWDSASGSRDLAGTSAKLVSGGCVVALASGRIYPDGGVAVGSVTDPGVEYFYAGIGRFCHNTPAGTPRWIQQYCGADYFLLEVLADDFFASVYGGSLADKIIFLNACSGLADRDIAKALTSGDSVVLGWSDPVPMGTAMKAADDFYQAYLDRNLPATDAWYEAASNVGSSIPAGLELDQGWRTALPPGTDAQMLGETELESTGSEARRGREMVSLRWPRSDQELEDGARIPFAPSGGECAPELGMVLEGIPEGQQASAIPLRLSVDGVEIGQTFHADTAAGPQRFRYDGEVPLPEAVDTTQPLDFEIWADLPRGGKSRWLYENVLVSCGCSFEATVVGDSGRGRVDGILATFSTRGQMGLLGGLGSEATAETKEDMLEAFKMVQGLKGGANPMLDALSEKWGKEIDEERKVRPAGGSSLTISLTETDVEDDGSGRRVGIATAFKLEAFAKTGPAPGFTGAVPLDRLAVHTGEFASEGLAPMLYRWDPSVDGTAQLVVDAYDGNWMEGTVTLDLPAIPGINRLDGSKARIRVTARFSAGLFNPLRMENVCLLGE